MHLVKREKIEAEDETKKIVEGSNKGGIASANDNNGENMASNNACVLNECLLRTNNILSSNSLETKVDFATWADIFNFHGKAYVFATKGW